MMPLLYKGIKSDRAFHASHALATFFAVGIAVTNIVFSLLWLVSRFWSIGSSGCVLARVPSMGVMYSPAGSPAVRRSMPATRRMLLVARYTRSNNSPRPRFRWALRSSTWTTPRFPQIVCGTGRSEPRIELRREAPAAKSCPRSTYPRPRPTRSRPGSARAIHHTKLPVSDRTECFVGSLNIDPRAVEINTENGVFIVSEAFCGVIAKHVEKLLDPSNSWRVELNERGKMRWRSGDTILERQPARRLTQRIADVFCRWLPVESQL